MGVSGANIYPTLLSGGDEKIITLGMSSRVRRIRTRLEHKAGATLDKFKSNLPIHALLNNDADGLLIALCGWSVESLLNLMETDLPYRGQPV